MSITPSIEQIEKCLTWQSLYKEMGLNPRNTRKCKDLQQFVRDNYPDSNLSLSKWGKGRFTDDQFSSLVSSCVSIRQVIEKGGWKMAGGTYDLIHKRIKRQQLCTAHFLGQAHSRGSSRPKKSIHEYLVENCFSITSHQLKLRLIKENIKEHQCEICGITEWMGQPSPIQLDHINGDHNDNRIDNLRILCPNCHAQTPTYSGKRHKKPLPTCAHCDEHVKGRNRVTCGGNVCMSKQHAIVASRRL